VTGPMRVLSVRQPWAWAIISGGKDVENRSRSLGPYRGPVAIQVSLSDDANAFVYARTRKALYAAADRLWENSAYWRHQGFIIGVVDLLGAHEANDGDFHDYAGPCGDWAENDGWHLMLGNPRPLSEPLPYRGGLGLRTLPADVEFDVRRRLA
jgi:hypothetical protein